MNALIVYDSYFGNTERIAKHVAETLGSDVPVQKVDTVSPESLTGLDLLVVGSPTRAFRPSDATKAFLGKIPSGALKGVKVAAFDTRMDVKKIGNPVLKFMSGMFGYAAKPISEALVKKGGVLVGELAGFMVLESEGPLMDGELERAAQWAESIKA